MLIYGFVEKKNSLPKTIFLSNLRNACLRGETPFIAEKKAPRY